MKNQHEITAYSEDVIYKDTLLKIDFNDMDEIINVWTKLGDVQHKITNLVIEHFPELKKLR